MSSTKWLHPATLLRRAAFLGLSLVALASAGCATAPPPRYHHETTVVVRPAKPHPHAKWVQGHHVYRHGRYVWVPGQWKRP